MSALERITVKASSVYDVVIGRGALCALAELVAARGGKFAVISDTNVAPHHLEKVCDVIKDAGATGVVTHVFEAGEASKNIETLSGILEALAEGELCRSDTVVALGGGVVGDITALSAALYMRGVSYVQIPTSIVAAVDSSVGGKCAVDLRGGKNLAGVFKQPSLVVCDIDLIDTLPDKEVSCGMAEVIKYGLGFDRELFDAASVGGRETAYSLIARCVDIKRRVVEEDEFDHGERMKLNLGHTAGHAIEKLSDFTISHGEAVAMGLHIMAKAFIPADAAKVEATIKANGLSVDVPFSFDEIARAALGDKKRSGDTISIVAPTSIGSCDVRKVATSELAAIFAGTARTTGEHDAPSAIGISIGKLSGRVSALPSKSEAHRALILAALSDEPCEVRGIGYAPCESPNVALADDILRTATALNALGAKIDVSADRISVEPIAAGEKNAVIDCGESGSTLRFMIPVCAAIGGEYRFIRRGRLPKRPINVLTDELAAHGMSFAEDGDDLLMSGKLTAGDFTLPGNESSQYITGLLMALPAVGESMLRITGELESRPYVDITLSLLADFGCVPTEQTSGADTVFAIAPASYHASGEVSVGGDWSGAANFLAMGVEVANLDIDSTQGDREIISILEKMGATTTEKDGAIRLENIDKLHGIDIDMKDQPDIIPLVCVLCSAARGSSRITGTRRLRLKESDRVESTLALIKRLGAEASATENEIMIEGTSLHGGVVDSFSDHRIAMAAGVAALFVNGAVIIHDAKCVAKSYPGFFDELRRLGADITLL